MNIQYPISNIQYQISNIQNFLKYLSSLRISGFSGELALMPVSNQILTTSGGGHRNWVPRSQLESFFHRLAKGP